MDIPENVLCLFSAEVEAQEGSYRIEVPEQELALGDVEENKVYRIAVFDPGTVSVTQEIPQEDTEQEDLDPPVSEGDTRSVEIEDIGKQGDGIARVERGYIIIVPDTEKREQVTVEISHVQENLAFGEVVEREEST